MALSVIEYFNAEITNISNYYPFGMLINERSYTSDTYRFGFNGMEKVDEVNGEGNSLDFGARVYDSRLGRWLSVDPLAYRIPGWSSYSAMYDNPIYWIDPNGLLEDDYQVNEKGDIKLINKTNDKSDKLFAVDNDGNKKDLNKDGNSNNDFTEIKNKSILPELSKKTNDGSKVNGVNNSDDLLKLFIFLAENTNVEWRFDRYMIDNRNQYALGTVNSERSSPTTKQLGYHYSKLISTVHSHPKSDSEENRELESMGYENGGTRATGDWAWHRIRVRGEYNGKKLEILPYPNYVYFPKSGNLYSIENNGPAFIRKINGNYKRFNFGVLNHN